jgi:predicted DNA-binding protein (MmcQ/YjbR family)
MTPDELRDYLLSFTGAEETFPFNPETSVFRVGGKVVREMVEDSYDLVVSKLPKAKRAALGWDGDA